jgi:hypothetical protein
MDDKETVAAQVSGLSESIGIVGETLRSHESVKVAEPASAAVISPELDTLIANGVHEELERYKEVRRIYMREYMRRYRARKKAEKVIMSGRP